MKNVHYFQRYHTKENMHTANAMLLLSRLFYYSPDKFYDFLRQHLFDETANLELQIGLQYKDENVKTIPDAIITQESFKVVIETKLHNNFNMEQLKGHIDAFNNEHYKLLLTLDCEDISEEDRDNIRNLCVDKNISHIHLTFASLIEYVGDCIDDRDTEFQDILDDYAAYCDDNNLLPKNKFKVDMRLAGTTINKNMELNLYYDGADKGFSTCGYIGLYTNKSMRAIGKITKRCVVTVKNTDIDDLQLEVKNEIGNIDNNEENRIKSAIKDSKNYDYDLLTHPHRFFFVEKFYETDFRKTSKRAPQGNRLFDICQILEIKDSKELPDTEKIAEALKNKTWE